MDGSGTVYVGDTLNNAIRRIDSGGDVTTIASNSPPSALNGVRVSDSGSSGRLFDFGCCGGTIVTGPNGLIFVADPGSNTVKQVDGDGSVKTVLGSGEAGFGNGAGTDAKLNAPLGLAIDASGDLVADTKNHVLRRAEIPAGEALGTIAGTYTATANATVQNGNVCAGSPWTPSTPQPDTTSTVVILGDPTGIALSMKGVGGDQLPLLIYSFNSPSSKTTSSISFANGTSTWRYVLCNAHTSSSPTATGTITFTRVAGGVRLSGTQTFETTAPACQQFCSETFRNLYHLDTS